MLYFYILKKTKKNVPLNFYDNFIYLQNNPTCTSLFDAKWVCVCICVMLCDFSKLRNVEKSPDKRNTKMQYQ